MGDDDVEEEDRSEDLGLGPHFLRACAVEMHFNISKEPLCTESCTKNAAPQIEPKTQTHTVRACAVEMHFNISQEPVPTKIYGKNAALQIEPRM